MTSKLIEKLKKSKEYRDAFVVSQVNIGIPFQIRALRKQQDRNWDQKMLAKEAKMLQPRISAMEQPGYGKFKLDTLMRLASAFDVALIVRFAPFSDLIKWSERFSPDNFQVQSFEKEFEHGATSTVNSTGNVYYFKVNSTDPGIHSTNNGDLSNPPFKEIKQDPCSVIRTDVVADMPNILKVGG